jgi:hypothetical protein
MGKHQRTVPENKDPEKVGQQPKRYVIYEFVDFQENSYLISASYKTIQIYKLLHTIRKWLAFMTGIA